MIHIATVHWRTDRWIDVQMKYLRSNVKEPFRVYAFLNGVDESHAGKYHYCSVESIRDHATKLNRLAKRIQSDAGDEDDLVVFLDGDAFPIDNLVPFMREKVREHRLMALCREENDGDKQPHPAFCATTVGFWSAIGGDWRPGFRWKGARGGLVTDVGGNLLGILERRGVNWYKMLRTNRRNLHPVWFGVYDDMIYHHGAGFRDPYCRHDLHAGGPPERAVAAARELSRRVYEGIRRDPFFFREFTEE